MFSLLVTGATGCIGRAVVKRALTAGWAVRGLARGNEPPWWPHGAVFTRASVEDDSALARASANCDAVIHLASPVHHWAAWDKDETTLSHVTVTGTANAARAARANRAQFVLISTIAVYGTPAPRHCDERTPTHPTTAYGRAKLEAEQVARLEHPDSLVLRCAVVYGPGDQGNVRRLIDSVARRRAFVVGDGTNRKSLVYAGNLADRVIACLTKKLSGTWCVSDTPPPTQFALMEEIARGLSQPTPRSVPTSMALGGARLLDIVERVRTRREGRWSTTIRTLVAETQVDGSALDSAIGYRPRTSLAEGIARAIESLAGSSETTART